MEKLSLRDLAAEKGLDYIETTTNRNGYPENIKGAIIGFKTFDEAQALADGYGLSIESFEQRDGWKLWYRTGKSMYEPFNNGASDYGDDYNEYDKSSLDSFYDDEIKPVLTEFNNLDDLEEFIKDKKQLIQAIEDADEGEIVITRYGEYFETIREHSMGWRFDTKSCVIGAINRNEFITI